MTAASRPAENTPILIVGGGPTGLLASLFLSRLEINHVLIEKRLGPQPAPAAHVINTRTMEILRAGGLNTDEFYALNKHADAHFVSWVGSPRDDAIGKFSLLGKSGCAKDQERVAHRAAASPEHTTNISQNLFEQALIERASNLRHQDIRRGHSFEGFVDGDTRRIRVANPEGTTYEISAEYVLAADGASSGVARVLNISKSGPASLATFLNLSCEVDLTDIVAERQSLLYWCLNPDTPGTLIVHDPKTLTVYMRPIFEPYESAEDYPDERCEALVKEIFGANVPFRIAHKGVWRMSAQVADRFSHGNVFLIGDAAHRFPPTGGLGLNSGAGDVHNLVWKLAAVLKHGAPRELLDSYEAERKPVAERNCATSTNNFFKMAEVTDAIGLDVTKAHLPAKLRSSAPLKWLPPNIVDRLLTFFSLPARRAISGPMEDTVEARTKRKAIQAAIDNQAEHFDMLGAELGYIYTDGIAVDECASATPQSTTRDYTPTAGVGARLPHIDLKDASGSRTSLDVISYKSFTLFAHGSPKHIPTDSWSFGFPCQTVDLATFDNGTEATTQLDLEPGGWVLVRPDGHVATRSSSHIA